MEWNDINPDDPQQLQRAVEIMRAADPRNRRIDFDLLLTSFRSSLARGATQARIVAGNGYGVVLTFRRRRRKNGYVMCVTADGAIEPAAVLDATLAACEQFAATHDIDVLYAFEPSWDMSPLMQQLYALARSDLRFERTIMSEMDDAVVLKFTSAHVST